MSLLSKGAWGIATILGAGLMGGCDLSASTSSASDASGEEPVSQTAAVEVGSVEVQQTPTADAAAPSAEPPAEPPAEKTEASPIADEPAAVFVDSGVAIRGADPVAYFNAGGYVAGSPNYTHEWGGATWQFSSAQNRDLFASNPTQYAPQYGGFCAWAVSRGYTAAIDPTAWKIVDGKLYLNFDARIQGRWAQDIPGNIARADQNWPGVLSN
ncbi:MAG: YHS domain-containing (seleno)protein [Cyanobacteria bacterium P01_F01_bin.4]